MGQAIRSKCKDLRFVLPEAKLWVDGNELPPIDFLLEHGEFPTIHALPCEVKASISNNRQQAIDELSRLKRYSGDFELREDSGEVKRYQGYCVVLILHLEDSNRIVNIVKDCVENGSLKMPASYTIWDFGPVTSAKPSEGEVILITTKMGKTGCEELDKLISNNIVVPINDFAREYETLKFTPCKPQTIVYTLVMLWQCVLTYLAKGGKTLVTKDTDVIKAVREYYGTWNGKSPIRSEWIKEALECLCKWDLAQRKNQGEYEIYLQKPNEKDLQDYFSKKVCGKETITTVTVTPSDLDKEQKMLVEFGSPKKFA
jgi:hypothetical protein